MRAKNEIGNCYGRLKVVKQVNKGAYWECSCVCGGTAVVLGQRLRNGSTKSCGCLRGEHLKKCLIDETGNRYGRLMVVRRAEKLRSNKIKCAYWKCDCDCGGIAVTTGHNLRKGVTKSCGCINKDLVIDEIGNRYGKLVVLRRGEAPKSFGAHWECKCDCGKTVNVFGGVLRNGGRKSCGCLRSGGAKLAEGENARNDLYGRYLHSAKSRGLEWALTVEQFTTITQQNCQYCGASPSNETNVRRANGQYIYNGIDRQDNSLGYTIDNAVPCCTICNFAKRKMSVSEFKTWGRNFYNYFIKEMEV